MKMHRVFALALSLLAAPAFSQARPAITGIAFMRVYTDDAPAAEKFYRTTLGYEEKMAGPGWMVFPVNHHQWIEVVPRQPAEGESYLAALGFTVADVNAMARYLHARGVQTGEVMHSQLPVKDPEGNLVIFVQAGTGSVEEKRAAETPLSAKAPSHHIIHVGMIVHDRAKEDAFWKDVLGFRPYWYGTMHPGNVDWVSLQVPDGTDWLEYMMTPSQKMNKHDFGMSDHFSLGVEHMQTVLHDLQRNGCTEKMCTAIQAGMDGKVQLNLFDPDQTRVEYMEFAPVMEPCCSKFTGPHPKAEE